MEIYFNDALLEKQYLSSINEADFKNSIKKIASFSNVIKELREEYRGVQLNFWADINILRKFFEEISIKDIGQQFLYSLTKAKVQDVVIRLSEKDSISYFFFDNFQSPPKSININNTSLAEIAEKKETYKDQPYLIINIPDLLFSKRIVLQVHRIDHSKNNETKFIQIDAADNEQIIREWVVQNLEPDIYTYRNNLDIPPTDNQTCLRSKIRFEETNIQPQGGRKVYKEIRTGYLWYVDSFHYGKKSHLEVFDKTCKYIGEADLSGHINSDKATDKNKKNRTLDC